MKFWKKPKICDKSRSPEYTNTTNNPMPPINAKYYKKFVSSSLFFHLFIGLLICLLGYLFIGLFSQSASALTMSNSNFIIQMGDFNSFAGEKSGSGYKLVDTGGQLAPGLFSGANYKVRAGFEYVLSIIPFSFKVSSLEISFGTLSPTMPVTRNNFLTVSNGSANGYQVTAQENHALLSPASGQIIPNTTCDNGLCTDTTSDVWTNTLTYGFGYRCDNISGSDCATGFASSNNYKQFSASPSASVVMSSTTVGQNREVQITYKVNISQTQAAGDYTNQIQYIATPTF